MKQDLSLAKRSHAAEEQQSWLEGSKRVTSLGIK